LVHLDNQQETERQETDNNSVVVVLKGPPAENTTPGMAELPAPTDDPVEPANREIEGYGDCGKLWAEVLQRLELEMAHSTFDTWLRNTEAIGYEKRSDSEEVLLVRTANSLQADWVANRLIVPVQRALKNALGWVPALKFVS